MYSKRNVWICSLNACAVQSSATQVEVLLEECDICQAERARRDRLMGNEDRDLSPGFASAPYITQMNRPRDMAAKERAMLFAQYKKEQVLWCRVSRVRACF